MINLRQRHGWGRMLAPFVLPMLLIAVLSSGRGAAAQPLAPMPLEDLVASASVILVGTVTAVRVISPENPFANYSADVQVEEVLKGVVPSIITICYPGPSTELSEHGTAQVPDLPQYALQPGLIQLFLLEGDAPMQLAHLRQGILPTGMLAQIRNVLAAQTLTATLTAVQTVIHPTQSVEIIVHLKNSGTQPQLLQLPRDLHESCRVLSWASTDELPNPPLHGPHGVLYPSEYLQTVLQPGEERTAAITLTAVPNANLTGPQQAAVAVWIYILLPDSPQPHCIATPPLLLTEMSGN